MKKLIACVVLAAAVALSLGAQSADKVTQVLQTQRVTWGQAAYFAVTARTGADSSVTEAAALDLLKAEGYAGDSVQPDDEIQLEQIALVCSSTWDISGSVWLLLKPSARYALRQMKADGIVSDRNDPQKACSGHEFLGILSKCIDTYPLRTQGGSR